MQTYGCCGGGQGTLGLIKVGRFVIQARLKSTGQESKCLGAQLQLPGEGCHVGAGGGRTDGEVHTCTQEWAKLHNEDFLKPPVASRLQPSFPGRNREDTGTPDGTSGRLIGLRTMW